MVDYGFEPTWKVEKFVRGTLRLDGWAEAWSDIFARIETLDGPNGEEELRALSAALWRQHAYAPGEADRVVLDVRLRAGDPGRPKYHKSYVLDAWGDDRGTAMARLVSVPVSLAVEAVLDGDIPSGLSAAPSDPRLVDRWLAEVRGLAQHMAVVDHRATDQRSSR